MGKFDRYMLSQLLVFFGFFALVLVAVFWINRSVLLFNRLIGDGQSVLVFLEFTTLGLPSLILLILPLASFAGAVYVTNRMSNDSELTVMIATGSSPWRLARPVLAFGLLTALMAAVLSHVLVPMAKDQLQVRENEVSQDVTAQLLTPGVFLHPSAGVTLYTREIGPDGVLRDVFLSDRRDPAAAVIYTADTAYLVRDAGETTLIMLNGLAQRLGTEDKRLSTADFDDFAQNIDGLFDTTPRGSRGIDSMSTPELMAALAPDSGASPKRRGLMAEELHTRFSKPVFTIVTALIGFSILVSRGFSRFGAWREILAAFALLLLLDGLNANTTDVIRSDAGLWPLAYMSSGLGFIVTALLLVYASRRRRPQSDAKTPVTA